MGKPPPHNSGNALLMSSLRTLNCTAWSLVCYSAEALYVQCKLLFNNNHRNVSAAAQSGCALHRGSDALPNIVECDTGPHSSTNSPENITKAAPLQCCTDCEQWSGSPLGGLGLGGG